MAKWANIDDSFANDAFNLLGGSNQNQDHKVIYEAQSPIYRSPPCSKQPKHRLNIEPSRVSFKKMVIFLKLFSKELPANKIDGNSQSGKHESTNVHDCETTVNLITDFSSNTDSVCTKINQQVSFNQ